MRTANQPVIPAAQSKPPLAGVLGELLRGAKRSLALLKPGIVLGNYSSLSSRGGQWGLQAPGAREAEGQGCQDAHHGHEPLVPASPRGA